MVAVLLAGFALAGCTDEDSGGDDKSAGAITFGTVVNGVTRAGEINNNTVNSDGNVMRVWGYKSVNSTPVATAVFDDQSVSYATATGWSYEPLHYWDLAADYRFWAVMPSTAQVTAAPASYDATTGFTITDIPAVQPLATGDDYMLSTRASIAHPATGKTVEFTLNHILSKFNVLARSIVPDASKYSITLNSLSILFPAASFGTATYSQTSAGEVTSFAAAVPYCDAWSRTTGSAYTAAVQTTALALGGSNYVKLAHSFLVAPTPVITGASPTRTPVTLTMQVNYTVSYDGNGDGDYTDPNEYNETYNYTAVSVQDLHYFTQGYITNLYVLFDMSAGSVARPNPAVIKFAVDEVIDWDNSDDNFVDGLGYAFNLRAWGPGSRLSQPALANQTTPVLIPVIIDNNDTLNRQNETVGTSSIVLKYRPSCSNTAVKFYRDKNGIQELVAGDSLTIPVATADSVPFYVALPSNNTTAVVPYTITVTTNQVVDANNITLYQAPMTLSATFSYGGMAVVPGANDRGKFKAVDGTPLIMNLVAPLPAAGVRVRIDTNTGVGVDITYNGTTKTSIFDGVTTTDNISISLAKGVMAYFITLSSGSSVTRYVMWTNNDVQADDYWNLDYGGTTNKFVNIGNSSNGNYGNVTNKNVNSGNEDNSSYGDGVNKNVTSGNSTNKGYGE